MPIVRIAILAAGQASRFGTNKLLQHWRGQSLLSYVLEAATQTCPDEVLVVTGAEAGEITSACLQYGVDTVFNPKHAGGIGTSIAAAARACEGSADGMLLLLGDQPLVDAPHLNALIKLWDGDPERICASRFANTLGPPVLFGRNYFERLAELKSDSGAKEIMAGNDQVIAVDFEPAAVDVDTVADMSELDKFRSGSE